MVLNHECFRAVLLYIEEKCIFEDSNSGKRIHEVNFPEIIKSEELKEFAEDDKYYIVSKLFEGKFVNGYVIPNNQFNDFDLAFISGLTLKGHDMVDNIHNDTIWNNTKSKLKEGGKISLSLFSQVVGETAAAYSKKMMNLE